MQSLTWRITDKVRLHVLAVEPPSPEAQFVFSICTLFQYWLTEATRTGRTQMFSYEIILWERIEAYAKATGNWIEK
jgi:hypothetical protein